MSVLGARIELGSENPNFQLYPIKIFSNIPRLELSNHNRGILQVVRYLAVQIISVEYIWYYAGEWEGPIKKNFALHTY